MPTIHWPSERVVVTGGAGFLGGYVLEELRRRGATEIFVPRSRDYDLVDMDAVKRLYRDARPTVVLHLAARVGGIGANRDNPGKFFYDNLMMGVQLIEEARHAGVKKFVALGTICAYPKFARCRSGKRTSGTATRRRPTLPTGSRRRCCSCSRRPTGSSTASTRCVLFPVNLYGPRDNFDLRHQPRHPGADPQVRRGAGAGRPEHRGLGRRLAHARVPARAGRRRGDRGRRRALRQERAGEPGRGLRDHDPRPGAARGPAVPASRARSSGTPRSRTASRGACSTPRGPSGSSAGRRASGSRKGCARPWSGTSCTSADRSTTSEEGAHHRHHRAGRLLPGGAAARKGYEVHGIVRRASHLQHRPHRPHLPRPAPAGDAAVPALRRPDRRLVAEHASCARSARRDLQPRRAEPRARVVRRAGVHRRGHRPRHASGCSRPSARPGSTRRASTRRRRRRCSAASQAPQNETTPFYPRSPYGVRQGLLATGSR